jgi:hypothetical protein
MRFEMKAIITLKMMLRFCLLLGAALFYFSAFAACGTSNKGFSTPIDCPLGGCDGGPPISGECVGLQCQINTCSAKPKTVVRGKVFDPSGKIPVYNAIVYIPNKPLEPFKTGASCERCATTVVNPVPRAVLTNEKGEFSIEGAPDGPAIPLVFQIGKWRRQVNVNVTSCTDNVFEDPALMHLPTKQSEGDMPKIAVVTGGCDPLGCILSRMGVDASEFTDAKGPGRVHVYKGFGGEGVASGTASPADTDLWSDSTRLKQYDMVLLACECKEHDELKGESAKLAMKEYLDFGGRVFATHYHYTWLKNGPAPLASLADWGVSTASSIGTEYKIEQGFAKGKAMADWLYTVGATPVQGTIDIKVPLEHLRGVKTGAQRWVYRGTGAEEMVKFFSFNAPVGAPEEQQCGRGVLSDIHISEGDGTGVSPNAKLPNSCGTALATAQERALEFMILDLSSCIQSDQLTPIPPK